MALSVLAQQFAAEIKLQDWSDAHSRLDRAGHNRDVDRTSAPQLTPQETDAVRTNVMWVVAQVLSYNDPNFNVYEFAEAAGVPDSVRFTSRGKLSGAIQYGLRHSSASGRFSAPGDPNFPH
ncbi:hypothetical protein BH11ACT4_BH11ACT4_02660 [soil metagenome]